MRQSRCKMLCETLRQCRCCKSTTRCAAQNCGIAAARHTAQKCGKAAARCGEAYAAKMLHAAKPLQGCTGKQGGNAAAKLSRYEMHRKIRRQSRCNTPQCGRAAAASECGEAAAGCTGKQGGKAAAKLISLPAWHRYGNGGSLSTQTISARALDKTPASSLLKLALRSIFVHGLQDRHENPRVHREAPVRILLLFVASSLESGVRLQVGQPCQEESLQ